MLCLPLRRNASGSGGMLTHGCPRRVVLLAAGSRPGSAAPEGQQSGPVSATGGGPIPPGLAPPARGPAAGGPVGAQAGMPMPIPTGGAPQGQPPRTTPLAHRQPNRGCAANLTTLGGAKPSGRGRAGGRGWGTPIYVPIPPISLETCLAGRLLLPASFSASCICVGRRRGGGARLCDPPS